MSTDNDNLTAQVLVDQFPPPLPAAFTKEAIDACNTTFIDLKNAYVRFLEAEAHLATVRLQLARASQAHNLARNALFGCEP